MADDNKPKEQPANPLSEAPKTPGEVKRTPIKHPQIIGMEKKIAELEDKTSSLEGIVDELRGFLEGAEIGAPSGQQTKTKRTIPVEFEAAKFKSGEGKAPARSDVDTFIFPS